MPDVAAHVAPGDQKLRQVDPWGLKASQLNLIGELEANERHSLQKRNIVSKTDTQDCPVPTCVRARVRAGARANTHTYTHTT